MYGGAYGAAVMCGASHVKFGDTSARFSGSSWHLIEGYTRETAFPLVAGRRYTLTFWAYSDYGGSEKYYSGADCGSKNEFCTYT